MDSFNSTLLPIVIEDPPPEQALPPEPIVSDYLEMGMLVLLFALGAPLNLAAYTQLTERGVHSRLDLLKQHLNYSDLLVIFLYVPSRALWLLTYDWRGGNLLCKVIKFFHTLAFQASSNVIVCIALDRLFSVLFHSHSSPLRAHNRTRIMLAIAWITAVVISLPQLYIWRDYLAFPSLSWSQCLQMWEIARSESTSTSDYSSIDYENMYSIVHVCLVFWIPSAIILISYLVVLSWVWLNSQPSACSTLSLRVATGSYQKRAGTTMTTDMAETALGTARDSIPYCKPRIVISNSTEECVQPLTNGLVNGQRQSNSSIQGQHFGNCQSYHARITRSRAIRVSFLLIAAYIICWLPYNLLSVVRLVSPDMSSTLSSKLYWLHGLVVFNCVVNPYLYGLFGPIFWRPLRNRADC